MNEVVEYPWALLGAPAFALAVALLFWIAFRRRAKRIARIGAAPLVARLIPPAALRAPWPRIAILGAAAACAAVAYAGPRWGMETTVQHASGVDVVLALDASLSMTAPDDRPSRLERMKAEARRLLALSPGDRIGLIAFAGHSYVLSPLTVDHGALELFIDNLDPTVVGQAGTSLSRALTQATDMLTATQSGSDKAIVVMSDGESWEDEDDITAATKRAADADITLITVGFGTEMGTTIPIAVPGGVQPKRDAEGRVVVTRYMPHVLEVAAGTKGTFIPATSTDKAARVRHVVASMHATGRDSQRATDRRARFQLFLLPALLLALIDTLLAERRGRRRVAPAASTTAVAASLLVGLAVPAASHAQGREGDRLYAAGQFKEAAEAYAHAIQDGKPTPRLEFNLGTALLAAGQMDEAASALERAANESKDLDLRYRALYNLGLAFLNQARAGKGDEAGQAYAAAAESYRRALRIRPDERDAKWNYELAHHPERRGGDSDRPNNAPPRPNKGIDPQQAQALLNSAQREERDTRAKQQKQNAPERPPAGKDW